MGKKASKASDTKRHIRFYKVLRPIVRAIFYPKFRFSPAALPDIEGNYLLLCNHNTDYDFILVGSHFKKHMYFVASEHIYHNPLLGAFLRRYCAPIARLKGTTASSTVMSIIRSLRRGHNICIFAEGNRSFNGLTCPILFSTGKLAKSSGVSLVTYRFVGVYFSSPRWSYTLRRGRMSGEVVNVYSPEQLSNMSDDDINAAIVSDLYEDAYARQAAEPTRFRGKRLAEGLEHALYICPKCGRIGTLHTKGKHLTCECGMTAVYDQYGTLNGAPYSTITEWDKWQVSRLHELIDTAAPEDELFSDEDVSLYSVDSDHEREYLGGGRLSMTSRELRCADKVFPLDNLSGAGIYGRCTIAFTYDDMHYEIKSKHRLCSVKYLEAYNYIKNKSDN